MVVRECVWDVCVCISCTGDEGQLGGSFVWSGEGVGVGRASVEKDGRLFFVCYWGLHV